MLVGLVFGVLQTLIPFLVQKAETTHPAPGSGDLKHAWVTGFVQDLFSLVERAIGNPGWAPKILDEVEPIISMLIEQAVEKIDPTVQIAAAK